MSLKMKNKIGLNLKLQVQGLPINSQPRDPIEAARNSSQILENIWISGINQSSILFIPNYSSACNLTYLKQEGFTHILNCNSSKCRNAFPNEFTYATFDIEDDPNFTIFHYFYLALEFITSALTQQNSKILLHCSAGISRAPALLASYIIWKDRVSVETALSIIQSKRSIVDPNIGFMVYLEKWQRHVMYFHQLNNSTLTKERTQLFLIDQQTKVKYFENFDYENQSNLLNPKLIAIFCLNSYFIAWTGTQCNVNQTCKTIELIFLMQKHLKINLPIFYTTDQILQQHFLSNQDQLANIKHLNDYLNFENFVYYNTKQ